MDNRNEGPISASGMLGNRIASLEAELYELRSSMQRLMVKHALLEDRLAEVEEDSEDV